MFTEFPIKSTVREIRRGAQKLAQLAPGPAFPGDEQLRQIIKIEAITVPQGASCFCQGWPQRPRETTRSRCGEPQVTGNGSAEKIVPAGTPGDHFGRTG